MKTQNILLWIPVVIRVTEVVTPYLKHKTGKYSFFQDSYNLKDRVVSYICTDTHRVKSFGRDTASCLLIHSLWALVGLVFSTRHSRCGIVHPCVLKPYWIHTTLVMIETSHCRRSRAIWNHSQFSFIFLAGGELALVNCIGKFYFHTKLFA